MSKCPVVLTCQQLSEGFRARRGDGQRQLVHGDTVSDRQCIYLAVGNLAGQQLPQQHAETNERHKERVVFLFISMFQCHRWQQNIRPWCDHRKHLFLFRNWAGFSFFRYMICFKYNLNDSVQHGVSMTNVNFNSKEWSFFKWVIKENLVHLPKYCIQVQMCGISWSISVSCYFKKKKFKK